MQLRFTPIRAIESSAWVLATLAANGYFQRVPEVCALLLQPAHFELLVALIATKNERIRGMFMLLIHLTFCTLWQILFSKTSLHTRIPRASAHSRALRTRTHTRDYPNIIILLIVLCIFLSQAT